MSIHGFPFLSQAAGRELDHVTISAGNFSLNTTSNAQGDYLDVRKLALDLHDVRVTSLSSRTAQANLVTGDVSFSYEALSGVITRLMGKGGALTVGPAAGSHGQEARIRVSGTWEGREVDTGGSLLAQGDEISVAVPGIGGRSYVWRVSLPRNAGFTAARSAPSGVNFGITGHQVVLGSSMYTR